MLADLQNVITNFRLNIKSGITVALVSIPLSVSLAVASQTTPVVGIVTAIWAGLIASIFGGSKFNIVGPTGALSGLLATYAIAHGAGALPTLAVLTGIFILFAYILKLERFLIYVPKSSIVGFTLGVALIIGFGQLNSALGLKVPHVHEKFFENFIESLKSLSTVSVETSVIFLLFLVGLFLFLKFLPKLPGAIALSPIGILIGYLSTNDIVPLAITTLGEKFPDISPQFFVSWTPQLSAEAIVPAITVAVIAILETMLSAKIADGMTKTKHNKRKEMLGLSLANIGSGLMGGIPATAALARTSLNIKSGATSNISATIGSVGILLISFFLISTFKFIPMAVIAAILVYVAIRMIEIGEFKHMYRNDKFSFFLSLFVAVVTVVEDPIFGILIGTVLSLVNFVHKLSEGQFEISANHRKGKEVERISKEDKLAIADDTDTLVYTIKGQLVYVNAQAHISRFEHKLNGTKNLVLRLRELYFVDLDGVEALDEILELCKTRGIEVYISGVSDFISEMCKNSNDYVRLQEEGRVVEKTSEALKALGVDVSEYPSVR